MKYHESADTILLRQIKLVKCAKYFSTTIHQIIFKYHQRLIQLFPIQEIMDRIHTEKDMLIFAKLERNPFDCIHNN